MARGAAELKDYLDTASRTGSLSREQLAAYASGLLGASKDGRSVARRSVAA